VGKETETLSRTDGGRLVRISGRHEPGQFVNVKITDSTTWALYGEITE
jgi:tRNA A37 methylthiotransferase MiaB